MILESVLVLSCSIAIFLLGILVLSYDFKRALYWATFFFAAIMAIQRISEFGMINAVTEEQVLFYYRWRCIGFFNTGVGFIAFWYYARMEEAVSAHWQFLIFLMILLPGAFFSYRLMFTPALSDILTSQPDSVYGFEMRRHRWLDHLSTFWFSFVLVSDVVLCWISYQRDTIERQKRWKLWIFLFILISSAWLIGYDLMSINQPRSLFSLNSSLLLTGAFMIYAWAFSDFQLFTVKKEKAIEEIVNSMHNLLLLTDKQLVIKEVNPATCQVLGIPPQEILDRSIADFLDPVLWQKTMDKVLSLNHTNERLDQEFNLGTEEQRYDILMTISPIFSSRNQPIGYIFIGTDLTAIRETQEKLEKYTADLKRSNQDLERFAHIASHDLKEPLRSITSFSMLLNRRYENKLDDEAKEYFGFIISNAKQMKKLIEDILVYSRIEARELNHQLVDLNKVLETVTQNLKQLLTTTKVQLDIAPLPSVSANKSHMAQLFQNLIENAVKYNDKENLFIQIQYQKKDQIHLFTIQDNGIGIEPRHQKQIFEMFKRLHHRGEYQGTGLGLAICKRIVEYYHGDITMESVPGKGTVFQIKMPA